MIIDLVLALTDFGLAITDNLGDKSYALCTICSSFLGVTSRSQISGAGTIFRWKSVMGSWRPAKCHHTAIQNIFPLSHITAGTVRQDFKFLKKCYRKIFARQQ
jgi:hypothetical protein